MEIAQNHDTHTLTICGSLDIEVAGTLRQALLDSLGYGRDLALDLSGVEACDTASLQVLLAAAKSATADGKNFRVKAASEAFAEGIAALGFSLDALN